MEKPLELLHSNRETFVHLHGKWSRIGLGFLLPHFTLAHLRLLLGTDEMDYSMKTKS